MTLKAISNGLSYFNVYYDFNGRRRETNIRIEETRGTNDRPRSNRDTSLPTIFSISHENLNLISSRSRNVNSGSQVVSTNCP